MAAVPMRSTSAAVLFALAVAVPAAPLACACSGRDTAPQQASSSELWIDPGDIAARDAFYGPGGKRSVPPGNVEYEVLEVDQTGYSGGYTVSDGTRKWDLKIGPEAQPEIVLNRVLWLIGYHQPVVHFVSNWSRKGHAGELQRAARFRLQSDHDSDGEWAWRENPYVGSRELKGLVIANLLLNNWDFKTSNNRIYTVEQSARGPARWIVVQDLGASLGRSGWPMGNRNDVDAFESQRFVTGVENGIVQFDYRGRHRELLDDLTPADLVWTMRLVSRISDRQWADVFRAASYPPDVAERYRTHIAVKIQEALTLDKTARVRR